MLSAPSGGQFQRNRSWDGFYRPEMPLGAQSVGAPSSLIDVSCSSSFLAPALLNPPAPAGSVGHPKLTSLGPTPGLWIGRAPSDLHTGSFASFSRRR